MNRYLFLLRHAEAGPEGAGADIERTLTERGLKSIDFIGDGLRSRGERVQRIYSSTARRAMQTARAISPFIGYAERDIVQRPELYLASPGDLLAFLYELPVECESLLLVGHNPGLQGLLRFLATPESLPQDSSMATATIARLEIPERWDTLQPQCARLVYLLKP
ncbi:MAG TPA: histidine phosphatase family protein [Gammaproteobacteria bacterium]|nr:histidine phosphatase family protein [Gammaproteobacteria bacterium]